MTYDMQITALGASLRLPLHELQRSHKGGEALAAAVREAWQDATEPASPGHSQEQPATVVLPQAKSAERFMESLSSDVTQVALQLRAGELIMLHAGGVALADGRVIAFVAPSGHGKTTLTRALATHYGYVSDETIAFDEQLRVYPYRKPLSEVTPGSPKQQVAPSIAGLLPLPAQPLRLAAVVLLDRIGAPESWVEAPAPVASTPMAPGNTPPDYSGELPRLGAIELRDALGSVVGQTSYLLLLDHPLQRLAEALGAVGTYVLRYQDAVGVRDAMPRLLEQLTAPVDQAVSGAMRPIVTNHESLRPEASGTEAMRPEAGGPAAAQLNVSDAIDLASGETAVLLGQQLHLLSDFAADVWRRAVAGQAIEQICAGVTERFGPPPGGAEAAIAHISQTLTELGDLGLL